MKKKETLEERVKRIHKIILKEGFDLSDYAEELLADILKKTKEFKQYGGAFQIKKYINEIKSILDDLSEEHGSTSGSGQIPRT